jgi:hypothetical protein
MTKATGCMVSMSLDRIIVNVGTMGTHSSNMSVSMVMSGARSERSKS